MTIATLGTPMPSPGSSFIDANDIPSEIVSILRKHPIFASINDESFISSLASAMHPRFAQSGDIIVKEGEEAKNMFFVIKGILQVQSGDGEVVFAQLEQGSFFGEIAILFSVNRTATVCAKTKSVLARLSAEELHNILERYPDVAVAINNEAEKRFTELKREMEKAGKKAPSMTFDDLQEQRKRDVASKSNSSLPLTNGHRNNDLDIGLLSAKPSNEFMYTLPLNHETPERSVPIEASSSYVDQKPIIIDQRLQDTLGLNVSYNNPNNDIASLGDSSTQVTPEVTSQAISSASEDNEDDRYDDDDEIFNQPLEHDEEIAEVFPHSEDSSTISDGDTSPSIPTGGRGHPMLAAFANQNGSRRRASVAVWSDDKLMNLANRKIAPSSELSKRQNDENSSESMKKRFAESVLVSDIDNVNVSPQELAKYGILGKFIMADVFRYLPFTFVFKMRGISRAYAELITDSDYNLIGHIDLSPWHKKINDKSLSFITNFIGPHTTKLIMKNCWGVSDKGLIKAATYMAELRHWVLASVWEISDNALLNISRSCHLLVELDLSNCRKITDAGALAVLSACPNLKNITLSYCKNLTDIVLDHPQWRKVRRLDLQRCTGITDAGFERWRHPFTSEQQQRSPTISNNQTDGHHVDGKDFNNNNDNSNLQLEFAMEELCLADCSFLTDSTITSLSLSCHNLRILSLSFCCALSESFVVPLVTGCPALEELDMSFCGGAVTDASLETLGKALASSLDKLSIRGCIQVTDVGLANLADHALALRKINASNCKWITPAGLAHWEPLLNAIFTNEKLEKGPLQRF